MVVVGVLIYFVLVLAALGWWFWPGLREATAWRVGQWRRTAGARARALAPALPGRAGAHRLWADGVQTRLHAWRSALRSHALPLGVAALLLAGVPLTALVLRHWWTLETFDHTVSRNVDPQVAALLQGEQLAPPAPLPPELFITREVTLARPLAGSASRQWELLDAEFRQRLLGVFKIMQDEHGIELVLIEGYRSPQRQTELAALGPQVTHAGAGQSWHQYGLAADCAFLFDGRIVIAETDPRAARAYALYGAVAQSFGLTWGGGWRSIKDLGHVELRRAGTLPPQRP